MATDKFGRPAFGGKISLAEQNTKFTPFCLRVQRELTDHLNSVSIMRWPYDTLEEAPISLYDDSVCRTATAFNLALQRIQETDATHNELKTVYSEPFQSGLVSVEFQQQGSGSADKCVAKHVVWVDPWTNKLYNRRGVSGEARNKYPSRRLRDGGDSSIELDFFEVKDYFKRLHERADW